MVVFLVNGQIESAFGSEIAGIANHNLDPNVVVVAQAARLRGSSTRTARAPPGTWRRSSRAWIRRWWSS
jgi:hypothetical protein